MGRVRLGIVIAAMLLGIGLAEPRIYLYVSYGSTMPQTPNRAAGRVEPMVVRFGTRVFVTHDEALRYQRARSAMNLAPIAFALAGILVSTSRVSRKGPPT
jgi:hypothetical protein